MGPRELPAGEGTLRAAGRYPIPWTLAVSLCPSETCMPRKPSILRIALAVACVGTPWSLAGAQALAVDACSVLTREEIKTLTGRDPGEIDQGESLGSTTCRWPSSCRPAS